MKCIASTCLGRYVSAYAYFLEPSLVPNPHASIEAEPNLIGLSGGRLSQEKGVEGGDPQGTKDP